MLHLDPQTKTEINLAIRQAAEDLGVHPGELHPYIAVMLDNPAIAELYFARWAQLCAQIANILSRRKDA